MIPCEHILSSIQTGSFSRPCGEPACRFFSSVHSGSPAHDWMEALCAEHGRLYDLTFVRAGVAKEVSLQQYLITTVHET